MDLPSGRIFGTEMPPMKQFFSICLLAWAAVTVRAALPQPDLIAQIHFAGAAKISADKNFSAFTNEFASAEARILAAQTLDKLARFPGEYYKTKMSPGGGDGVAQLRPLLDDLLTAEWFFEARDTANGSPEYALAIRLNNVRAQLWQNNLQQLLEAWTKLPAQKIAGGWELKKHVAPDLIRVTENNGWLIVDCGQNNLSLGNKILARILASQVEKGWVVDSTWLSADVNWPRLAQTFPALKELDLPETKFVLSAENKNLHLTGNFFFPQNLAAGLPAWQLPTNTIHAPFVSFTAARGVASWLSARTWAQPYAISPVPDQLFSWALPNMPFQTYVAVPVPDAAGALAQSFARLSPAFNGQQKPGEFLSPFKMELKGNQINWTGVPFISPYMQAVNEKSGQFLLAGAFPNPPRGKPLPPELFQRLAQNNLVFYHWEITAERFPQILNLTQLGMVLTRHRQLEGNSAALKWLQKITPALGNTVTEIFRTAPDQMSFTRSAPGGLTAFELLALADWLEAPDFPGCDLKLAPPSERLKQLRLKHHLPAAAPGAP
jgi:hypothetical protein